jgi:glutathione S-transferase
VILDYLAEVTRKFGPKSDGERLEILRWILFDNHKFTANLATLRFQIQFAKTGETPVTEFLRGRAMTALKIVDGHLAKQPFLIGKRATIADLSMCAYPFYGEELTVPLEKFPNIVNWLDRIRGLPGWKHAYDLMPRVYQPKEQ